MLLSFSQWISAVFVALAAYPAAHKAVRVAVSRCQAAWNTQLAAFTVHGGWWLHTSTMPSRTDKFVQPLGECPLHVCDTNVN